MDLARLVAVASAFFSLLLDSYAALLSSMNVRCTDCACYQLLISSTTQSTMSSGAPDRELVESALSLLREARTVMAEMDEENAYLAERAGTQATKLLDERCV
jgi:hypothetical protein